MPGIEAINKRSVKLNKNWKKSKNSKNYIALAFSDTIE
jgi:hypothetical protein